MEDCLGFPYIRRMFKSYKVLFSYKGPVIFYRLDGGWGGGEYFRGDHLIFGKTKGGISGN